MSRPTLRHAAVAAGVAVVAAGGYLGLRSTSAFAVDRVTVTGGDPAVRAAVEAEARTIVGDRSLLAVDAGAIEARLQRIPAVRTAVVDRAFPNRLDIRLVPEVPVARLPFGELDAIVSRSGRVLDHVPRRRGGAGLPVLAAAPAEVPEPGGRVQAPLVLDEIRVADAAVRVRVPRITSLRWTPDGLVARATEGWLLRLGDAEATPAKLVAARGVIQSLAKDTRADLRYVDVSAPGVPAARTQTGDPLTLATTTVDVPPPDGGSAADAAETGTEGPAEEWQVPAADATDVLGDLFGHGQG